MGYYLSNYLGPDLIKEKVEILVGFCIPITREVKLGLSHCKTEIELDRYCHRLIFTALGDD